ncbi:MAG: hypothetical protein IT361_03410 [Gemmatimonadaceae bacterium]|nr:hypothetical protein [Gemmatimonadaceae bacterium]
MSQTNITIPPRRARAVRAQDRLLDLAAAMTLISGLALFAIGRAQLAALAGNTYDAPPKGVTWVSRAERHDAQTRWGAMIAGAGLILCVGAAVKHASARRFHD